MHFQQNKFVVLKTTSDEVCKKLLTVITVQFLLIVKTLVLFWKQEMYEFKVVEINVHAQSYLPTWTEKMCD